MDRLFENDMNKKVAERYLIQREQVLNYTNKDMNLLLNNDKQVYIAVFDIPLQSNIVGFQTQTLALVFGLNVHIYNGNGEAIVNLEKDSNVMQAMQSLFVSSSQVLPYMKIIDNFDFYNSKYVRAYLKTKKGVYFKELKGEIKSDKFLLFLMNNVIKAITNN